MTVTVALPALPREVPLLAADPAAIRAYAAAVLAGSAQIDELGRYAGGGARIDDWAGLAATSYHASLRPIGRTADAVALALRNVARRTDEHADRMRELLARRERLVEERSQLARAIEQLRSRIASATAADAASLQAEADDLARRVRSFDTELDRWTTDLIAEEEAMNEAFQRVAGLDQVERRYAAGDPADPADPADSAFDRMPGPTATAREVNEWWDGLARDQQLAVIAAAPGSIGNLDGIPAVARDAANRLSLERDLAEWSRLEQTGALTHDEPQWLENARSAQDALGTVASGVDPVTGRPVTSRLHVYDPAAFDGDGAVAVSAGDLATADNVAVVVPGLGTDGGSAAYQAARVLTIHESSRFLAPDESNATMFWIGYDAPDNLPWHERGWDAAGVVGEDIAHDGGARLADAIDGLRASRDGDRAHLTAIGHSYGSTTTGHAAHDHGLPVDDLVLVGSPGVGADTNDVADTGVDPAHVWAGANSHDPIADLGNSGWVHLETLLGAGLGDDPVEDDFGAQRFRAESTGRGEGSVAGISPGDHAGYFDHDSESLYNISQIVNGSYAAVQHAEHVHDPWYARPRDPEVARTPAAPDTDGRP